MRWGAARRIRGAWNVSTAGMEGLVREKLSLLEHKQRTLEDFDMRVLTSGIYIYGLREWGLRWPDTQLLLLRSEDLFADTPSTMRRVQAFLGLERPFASHTLTQVRNRNTMKTKTRPTRWLNATLDAFFAPYNEELYAWAAARAIPFKRWSNATCAGAPCTPL